MLTSTTSACRPATTTTTPENESGDGTRRGTKSSATTRSTWQGAVPLTRYVYSFIKQSIAYHLVQTTRQAMRRVYPPRCIFSVVNAHHHLSLPECQCETEPTCCHHLVITLCLSPTTLTLLFSRTRDGRPLPDTTTTPSLARES